MSRGLNSFRFLDLLILLTGFVEFSNNDPYVYRSVGIEVHEFKTNKLLSCIQDSCLDRDLNLLARLIYGESVGLDLFCEVFLRRHHEPAAANLQKNARFVAIGSQDSDLGVAGDVDAFEFPPFLWGAFLQFRFAHRTLSSMD
jgi:hypothetical protein